MRFSIITVVYNDAANILKTLNSIVGQTFDDFELIIVDGGSTDGTVKAIESRMSDVPGSFRWSLSCERDEGIYDAMNKGVAIAKGDYIFFLNSGDVFATETVLERCAFFLGNQNHHLICGNVVFRYEGYDKVIDYFHHHRLTFFWIGVGIGTCHQAVFVNRDVLKSHPFDTSFVYLADQELFAYMVSNRMNIIHMDVCVAIYDTNGFSASGNITRSRMETDRINRKYNRFWWGFWRFPKWIVRRTLKND